MVAKITVPGSIRRALNYNEQKVQKDAAKCIYAHNFLGEAVQLNFHDKLMRFENLIALNKRAATNSLHISLNFGPNENLSPQKMTQIATSYMESIGFGDQPYLVYQHLDAGHPHIHIVSTNIQDDGKRISLHNIGRDRSEMARKEIEIAYGLQKAEGRGKEVYNELSPVNLQRVVYGKSATKAAITNVLNVVLSSYKYTSLAELNAVLGLYNVAADRGKEGGLIYQKQGLLYRVLDDKGAGIGMPIKASSIYSKPTLSFLEAEFKLHEVSKLPYKKKVKSAIDWIMTKPPSSIEAFTKALEKEKISLVVRQNEGGAIYGLTYVDHNTKCVFNGSEIGKEYSAKAVLEKLGKAGSTQLSIFETPVHVTQSHDAESPAMLVSRDWNLLKVLDVLTDPIQLPHAIPYELRRGKRRRKKSL